MPKPLAIASDHAAFELKAHLKETLTSMGVEFQDLGPGDDTSVDYPDFAHRLAAGVADGTFELGVLVCGTGQGMAMSANRHPGVRAALCADTFSAHMAREHNDANVLCMGARVVGVGLADDILKSFVGASFEGGRHARRVGKIRTVKLPPSDAFVAQRARFDLRFNCEDCALFDAASETCAHGFPTREHRRRYYEDPRALIVFCKDFDLI